MRSLHLLAFVLLLPMFVTLGSACEEKQVETGKGTVDQLQPLRDEMCACKDAACTIPVQERFDVFVSANMHEKGDKFAQRRATRLIKEFRSCRSRAKLATATIEKNKKPMKRFPVNRVDPQLSLTNMVPGFNATDGGQALEVSFDVTLNRQMAFSHQLVVHSRCVGGDRPRADEWEITGKALGVSAPEATVSTVATFYKSKPLAVKPKSCTVSFRMAGAPADFERVCVRGDEITPDECADEAATPAQFMPTTQPK